MGQCFLKDSPRNQDDREGKDDATRNVWKTECMGESMSFHGSIDKMEAQSKLRDHGGTCFLTRYDEATKTYLLSVMATGMYNPEEFQEFRINIDKYSFLHQFGIQGKADVFGSIVALLEFYQRGQISRAITSIGEEVKRPLSIQETFDGNMRESISFHGQMDEMGAETRLREHGGDCFLTRYSEAEGAYMLSVMTSSGENTELRVNATKIKSLPQFSIEGREESFRSMVVLLDYYQKNPPRIGEEIQRPNITTSNIVQSGEEHEAALSAPAMRAVPLWEIQGFSRDPSYHGVMKGRDADWKLREHGGDRYLTRYSEVRSKYVLTIKRRDQVVNFDLGIDTGEGGVILYEIVGTEVKFRYLRKLLDFYRNNPVSHQVGGIGEYLESSDYIPTDSTDAGFVYYSQHDDGASAAISADLKSCDFHKHPPSSPRQHYLNLSSSSHQRQNSPFLSSPNSASSSHQRQNSPFLSSPNSAFPSPSPSHQRPNSFSHNISNSPTSSSPSHRPYSSFHPPTSTSSHQHRPDLSRLSLLKWTSSSGEVRELAIMDRVSSRWRSLGVLIGLNMSELDSIQEKTLRDDHRCCRRVFSKWLDNDGHHSYPISWEGLQELLKDVRMNTVASNLKEALACPAH